MPGLGDLCASPESPRQLTYVLVVAIAQQPVSGEMGEEELSCISRMQLGRKGVFDFSA